jgi:hypothetical protein
LNKKAIIDLLINPEYEDKETIDSYLCKAGLDSGEYKNDLSKFLICCSLNADDESEENDSAGGELRVAVSGVKE